MPKIRNIIIFLAIGAALVFGYIFFVKQPSAQSDLVSSNSMPSANTATSVPDMNTPGAIPSTQDFLTLLLNVQNIKLNDAIFSDPAFNSLHDSSITLVPDGTEGRPNPFDVFGSDTPLPSTTPAPVAATNIPTTAVTTPAVTPVPATTTVPASAAPATPVKNTTTSTTPVQTKP